MPSSYKTPGVYIEEISKFPPSVAEVETAIPAFIGYTAQAKVRGVDYHDPKKVAPVRITSLLEYEQFFGQAQPETGITVTVTATGEVSAAIASPSAHNMYYSLQAYFANGGGPCYIVSVGKPTGTIVKADLEPGLAAIEKEDEITLIVFPEILSLKLADSAGLYDAALAQCAKLQDRFVVMDAQLDAPDVSVFDAAGSFRSTGVGANNLKYGAAYGPRVATIFDYQYNPTDGHHRSESVA
jgi:uncharacterized protein